MRPLLIAFSLFLSAFLAFSQTSTERPISSAIYGPASGDQVAPVAASNGTDFFVAWQDGRGAAGIYATRVASDGRVLDETGIPIPIPVAFANLRILGVFWISGAYVVVYSGEDFTDYTFSTYVVRIDDRGEIVDPPRVVANIFGRAAASNGSRIVIAGERGVAVLDDQAHFISTTNISSVDAYGVNIGSNGSTFLMSTFTYDGTNRYDGTNWVNFTTFDAVGNLIRSEQVRSSGSGNEPLIGSDGRNYLVLYHDAASGDVAQGVAGDGTLASSIPIGTFQPSIGSSSLVWTGDRYLLVGTSGDPNQDVSVAQLDSAGRIVSFASALSAPGTAGVINVPAVAAAGSKVIAAWTTGDQFDPSDLSGLDIDAIFLDGAGDARSSSFVVAISGNPQTGPVIGTGASRDVVVWREPEGLYATRLSADGSAMDGRGIQIAADPIASGYFTYGDPRDIRIVGNGESYVAAWTDMDGKLSAQWIDADSGALVGPRVALATCASSFDIARDDSGVVAFVSDCSNVLTAQRIGMSGPIGGALTISPPDMLAGFPRAAWNGSEWLVAFDELIVVPTLGPVTVYWYDVRAERLSGSLNVIDPGPIAVDPDAVGDGKPIVATNGNDFLIAWSRGDTPRGVYARSINADGTFADNKLGIAIAGGAGSPTAAVWDGTRYAVEFTSQAPDGTNQLKLSHLVGDRVVDAIAVSPQGEEAHEGDLVPSSDGRIEAVYARTTSEPLYGGVIRVFSREIVSTRQRPSRRR